MLSVVVRTRSGSGARTRERLSFDTLNRRWCVVQRSVMREQAASGVGLVEVRLRVSAFLAQDYVFLNF